MKTPGGLHFYASLVKSVVRISGCTAGLVVSDQATGLAVVCISMLVAEIIGIAEEFFDSRA